MKTIIPKIPETFPPTTTASSVQMAGSPTEPPTTLGYTICPSICCTTRNTATKMITCFKPSTEISRMPKTIPIKAPTKGIRDIAPIINEIVAAYGKPPMVRAAKNINPNITASRHCPDKKLEKTL